MHMASAKSARVLAPGAEDSRIWAPIATDKVACSADRNSFSSRRVTDGDIEGLAVGTEGLTGERDGAGVCEGREGPADGDARSDGNPVGVGAGALRGEREGADEGLADGGGECDGGCERREVGTLVGQAEGGGAGGITEGAGVDPGCQSQDPASANR
eukprot:Hpha_TRINITY_DN33594_c0_g1::TRINITY_DN33594_c0_g1_i1::g.171144::m.171144